MIYMKLIIAGKSSSGKDYLLHLLKNNNFSTSVKYTTRPRRSNEINGLDYNFINNKEFNILKLNNQMVVNQSFIIENNIWQYGFTINDFKEYDIFILTPDEISQLPNNIRNEFTVLYLNIDIYERYKRLYNRKDNNDDILRRIHSDEWDFRNFNNYDIQITNKDFNVEQILDLIYKNKQ